MSSEDVKSMNIYQRLAGIRKMVEVIRKNKSGYNYKYVSEDEILAKVTAGMDKYHVLLYPSIVPQTASVTPFSYTKTKTLKDKSKVEETVNEVLVNADMTFTWVNLDNPQETLTVPWMIVGQQSDASQAVGSGLSYLHRYFLLKFFQIATPDDDPDNWRSKKEEAEFEADAAVAKQIVTKIDAWVHNYLNANQNSETARKTLIDLLKKYVRDDKNKPSADYMNYLVDPTVAATLLEELKKQCPVGSDNTEDNNAK